MKKKAALKHRLDKSNPVAYWTIFVLLSLYALLCVYPFYYILIYSISIPNEAMKGIFLFPRGFTMENYMQLFTQNNILRSAFVSVSRTIVGTFTTVFCTSFFAYLLTQDKLKFRKSIYRLVVMTMYINAGLIPWYMTMKILGLKNSFLLYVLPSAIVAFYLVLIKTYIEQLPGSLQESAMIDGAGPFRIFIRIIMPICIPVLATVAIFTAVDQWNAWIDNFYLVDIPELQTLQLLLLTFMTGQASQLTSMTARLNMKTITVTPTSIRMTITMIVTLPILVVYPVFQRYFVKGILIGAIKG